MIRMIQSVHKAMRILSVIANGKSAPVSLARIAQETGWPKPTCAHIVETLCQDGYVQRVSHSEGYRLGPALYHLTRYGRYDEELISLCHPVLKWMERTAQATAMLAVVENGQKFIIDYVDTEPKMFPEYQQIRKDDLYRTASGRVILSRMDRAQAEEIYRQYGAPPPGAWDGVTSWDSLCRELERIRSQPTASVQNASTTGIACALMHGSVCLGAVGLGWLHDSLTEEALRVQRRRAEQTLLRGTREIERRLSYQADET